MFMCLKSLGDSQFESFSKHFCNLIGCRLNLFMVTAIKEHFNRVGGHIEKTPMFLTNMPEADFEKLW